MYLISLYFDEKANRQIQRLVEKVAKVTGNQFMVEGKIPPHITVSAFEAREDVVAIDVFEKLVQDIERVDLEWVCVGQFFPNVIFLLPVLNRTLQQISENAYKYLQENSELTVSACYRPFQWVPHTTIAKMLTVEEMQVAFRILQENFCTIRGQGVKIGLAKTNPHQDIVIFDL